MESWKNKKIEKGKEKYNQEQRNKERKRERSELSVEWKKSRSLLIKR